LIFVESKIEMAHKVWNTNELRNRSQHDKVDLFIISPGIDYPIPVALDEKLQKPHRLTFYFFVYRIEGTTRHSVDFNDITVKPGELLFLLPHQIHMFPPKDFSGVWFKMAITENTLAQLPASFPFLLNPLNNNQVIDIGIQNENRIKACFAALEQIVHGPGEGNQALIIAYLSTLLTELDLLYFKNSKVKNLIKANLSVFTRFKLIINEQFKSHPSILYIASELHISESKLYSIVKSMTGVSPKEYFLNHVMLEARRCLFYKEFSPKELSYHLGFNDPGYFFRIFKKYNKRSITRFQQDLEEMSLKIQE